MSFCFLCNCLEPEDLLCDNKKCIYIKKLIKKLGVSGLYDILHKQERKIFNYIDIQRYRMED